MAQIVIFTGAAKDWTWSKGANLERPLGAYQIASILRGHGYTVQVIDYWYYLIPQSEKFVNIFKKYVGPETLWIGWSNTFLSPGRFNAEGLIDHGTGRAMLNSIGLSDRGFNFMKRYAKEQNPNIKFVTGGAKTYFWSHTQESYFFDYFISGYADATALHLTEYLAGKRNSLKTFPNPNGSYNIIYDTKGNLFDFNNHRHIWHKSDYIHNGSALPIEIARGCIFQCSYCSFPLNGKKKNDYIRDPSQIIDELVYNYEEFGTTQYMYSDDTHNDSVDKLEFLYDNVYSKLPFKIKFATYLRLDLLAAHPHTIPLLKESGLNGTFFGIESFNKEANKLIGKTATRERLFENLHKCKEVWKDDVIIMAGLILGLPNDDEETCSDWLTEALCTDSPIDSAAIAPLQLLPNNYYSSIEFQSDMERNPEKYGYTFDDNQQWINNKGWTKYEAVALYDKFNEYQTAQNTPLKGWYDPARADYLGISLDEYYTQDKETLTNIEDKIMENYFDDLLYRE